MTRRNSELQGGKQIAATDGIHSGQKQAASGSTHVPHTSIHRMKADGA